MFLILKPMSSETLKKKNSTNLNAWKWLQFYSNCPIQIGDPSIQKLWNGGSVSLRSLFWGMFYSGELYLDDMMHLFEERDTREWSWIGHGRFPSHWILSDHCIQRYTLQVKSHILKVSSSEFILHWALHLKDFLLGFVFVATSNGLHSYL